MLYEVITLPQALAADPQFAGQFGLAHGVLMFQHEALEIVFQGQVFIGFGHGE